MANRQLSVVPGDLSRSAKPKTTRPQDALAKRWRASLPAAVAQPAKLPDVVSLMDLWIRRLEREAGTAAQQTR